MQKSSVVIIVNKEGFILGVPRKNNPHKFGFVGGKCDPGESFEETALRETKEETGLEILQLEKVYERIEPSLPTSSDFCFVVCFAAVSWKGKISTEEGQPQWLYVEQFTEFDGAFQEYNR